MKQITELINESSTAGTNKAIRIMKNFVDKYGETEFINALYDMCENNWRQGISLEFAKYLQDKYKL